jgi:carbonic anhydrase
MLDPVYRFDPATLLAHQMSSGAEKARQLLLQGNREFAEMTEARNSDTNSCVIPLNPKTVAWAAGDRGELAQAPFAAILGCADARVPPEMVFGKGCNELFVVRVAGNILGPECLGSLRFAISHFATTLKLVVVLAHSHCGAVTEAVNIYLEPRRYLEIALDYSLRLIEDRILVPVRVAALSLETLYGLDILRYPESRPALLEAAIVLNAAWSAYCLREEFRSKFSDLGVVFGSYDLVSRKVRLPLSPNSELADEEQCLITPPEDVDGFRQLADRVCGSKLVRRHLSRSGR